MDNTKQQEIIDLLNDFKGDKEFASYEYPNIEEKLQELLKENGYVLEVSDFLAQSDTVSIDSDGFPFIRTNVFIMNFRIIVKVIVIHHHDWDFYIEEVI